MLAGSPAVAGLPFISAGSPQTGAAHETIYNRIWAAPLSMQCDMRFRKDDTFDMRP